MSEGVHSTFTAQGGVRTQKHKNETNIISDLRKQHSVRPSVMFVRHHFYPRAFVCLSARPFVTFLFLVQQKFWFYQCKLLIATSQIKAKWKHFFRNINWIQLGAKIILQLPKWKHSWGENSTFNFVKYTVNNWNVLTGGSNLPCGRSGTNIFKLWKGARIVNIKQHQSGCIMEK